MKKLFVVVLLFAVVLPGSVVLFLQNEGNQPLVAIDLPSKYIKKSCVLKLGAMDSQTGLRNVHVTIMQNGNEHVLLEKDYKPSLFSRVLPDANQVLEDNFSVPVETEKYGMADGPAVIRVRVSDASWRGWGKGNLYYEEKEVILDSTPPNLKVLSRRHNLCKGGSGLAIYQVFESDVESGVKVGDHVFPGYSGMFENPDIHVAFFALDHTQGPGTKLMVYARDKAGNISHRGFRHYIRDKKFVRDTITVTEDFLEEMIAPFDLNAYGKTFDSLLDKFLFINTIVREKNSAYVLGAAAENTAHSMMWEGKFLRMAGATRSGYADQRTYKYKGKEVSKSVHLGKDLASTANARIGAANSGHVILAEDVGIFGNTVIIDHGFGVASLYSHLDSIGVKVGQNVKKGDAIGTTGMTGLAGGDHLHFSVIIHDVFVTPLEWWDSAWIKNNITSKIQRIKESQ